ncbi:unnamed protein product [Gordionus sp. m RMFG-2023]|uniref:U6 snRNA-associated Sm-like protein LSm1 n=1 Tax=Gordionus sp. m RMFG-2023 TaxID=3053472 RepID=UPI0030E3842E
MVQTDLNPRDPGFLNFLPGTVNLVYDIDKKLMVWLRDGRILIGFLRSVDQYANLVLQQTIERIYVGKQYGEIHKGIYIVRGENVTLLAEMHETPSKAESELEKVSFEQILSAQSKYQQQKLDEENAKKLALKNRGFSFPCQPSHYDNRLNEDWY